MKMPPLPPLPPLHSLSLHHPFDDARDYAIAYGRAVAEACAVKCEELCAPLDPHKWPSALSAADAIREMANAAKPQQQE